MGSLKREIIEALLMSDFGQIVKLSHNKKKVFRTLISLSYDKEDILSWRAIEAMGKAVCALAESDPSAARNIVQRLLWSIRDESGGIGWGAPEMLGEVVRSSPKVFADLPPVIFSFHDEEPFLKGILWAMGRIVDVIDCPVEGAKELAVKCLDHKDPSVRGTAVWAASRLGVDGIDAKVETLLKDEGKFKFYEGNELRDMTVGDMADRLTGHIKS